MGIFNEDGEKVADGKLASPSPDCNARVQVTGDDTGPLFVAVRLVGWQYMFGNYSVEVREDD